MGQKINPIANRLGIIRGWDSNWFGGSNFGKNILEDSKIREYLDARFKSYIEKPGRGNASKKEYTSVYEYISRTVIERTPKLVTITICTSRPGMIIGQGGKDVEALKAQLQKITNKDVQINIYEVKKADIDANIVGKSIARQIRVRAGRLRIPLTLPASTSSPRAASTSARTAPISIIQQQPLYRSVAG